VNRVVILLTFVLSLLAPAGAGMAQPRHHGDEGHAGAGPNFGGQPRFGAAPPGRYAPPMPGGRYAGPYGYAYPAGVYPAYPAPQPYPPPSYPGAPPPRRPNSLGANWRPQQEEARAGVRHGQFAPLGRVIETIQRRTPGRQLDAGIEYDGGRAIYRVRWITVHGRRVDFLVDAATGAILGER
jgi:hypothetical protein